MTRYDRWGYEAYPHPRIPAARATPCFAVFSSMCGNPEVGGVDRGVGGDTVGNPHRWETANYHVM